jgi:transcriptional regulator with XRE-family HTH domain
VRKKNIIGSRIREARRKAKVTQMELAARLQLLDITIDRSGIAKLELGMRPISDIEIIAIAKILNVSIQWLFEKSEDSLNLINQQ